jgi:Flp pilus assembly protein TadB
VDAAFAAQKEAAAKQDEANAKAIEKSERATAETIKTNQELSLSKIDALTNQMTDLKGRLDRGEGQKAQAVENKGQSNWLIGVALAAVAIVVALASLFVHLTR